MGSASDWILQVTRRSPEPDTSICLPGLGPLLILLPHVQAKDTETVHLIPKPSDLYANLGRGQMPSTVRHPTPRSQSPTCQVGTRLRYKLGRWTVWWLVLCLASCSLGLRPRLPAEADTLPGWHEPSLRLHHCLAQTPQFWHCCLLIKAGTVRCSRGEFIIGTYHCLFDCDRPAIGLQGSYALTKDQQAFPSSKDSSWESQVYNLPLGYFCCRNLS